MRPVKTVASKPTARTTVVLQLRLPPMAYGALDALTEADGGTSAVVSATLTRLLRGEIERLAPGAWGRIGLDESRRVGDPRDQAQLYRDAFREALR
jgi:hypothetical protein